MSGQWLHRKRVSLLSLALVLASGIVPGATVQAQEAEKAAARASAKKGFTDFIANLGSMQQFGQSILKAGQDAYAEHQTKQQKRDSLSALDASTVEGYKAMRANLRKSDPQKQIADTAKKQLKENTKSNTLLEKTVEILTAGFSGQNSVSIPQT